MTPAPESIALMLKTYCMAISIDMTMNPVLERQLYEAHKMGLTAYDLGLVLKERQKLVKAGKRHAPCLLLRNLVGNDESVADVLNESAMIQARMRVRTVDPNKAKVMEMTGRELKPKELLSRSAANVLKGMINGRH